MEYHDYIIIGAGASGLLLADAMGKDPFFKHASVLLLDKGAKNTNDRTWCFWEEGKGDFEEIRYAKWPRMSFEDPDKRKTVSIAPYTYKMIRGIDFYECYFEKIKKYPNIRVENDVVDVVKESSDGVVVYGEKTDYLGQWVFDSRFSYQDLLQASKYPVLQQHFVGWFIKTDRSIFRSDAAIFMDFSIPQKGNTRFMYVLPFSEKEALVEYTLFSKDLLDKGVYENAIKDYLSQKYGVVEYEVLETERGSIPMTSHNFSTENTDRYFRMGLAGGWAKPSTGFTFYNSTRKVKALVDHLKKRKPLSAFQRRNRFWLYDILLLDILDRQNHLGAEIFSALFQKRETPLILRFLDEQTTPWEELKVIWACPKKPFINALLKRVFRLGFPK